MAKKKENIEEKVLTDKEKNQLKNEALKELNGEIKDKLVSDVVEDVKKEINKTVDNIKNNINIEYTNELKENITSSIIGDIKNDIKKEQNKLIRKKTFKIFRLEIYILVLLVFIGFLIFRLYKCGGLDILNNIDIKNNNEINEVVDDDISTTTNITTTTTTKSRAYYISKYRYLLDNIKIENKDIFNQDNLISNMEMDDKLKLVYYTLTDDDIIKDGIIYQISNDTISRAYKALFGLDDYKEVSFSVNNLKYAYSSNNDTYIAIYNNTEDKDIISNNIYDFKEENEYIKFYAYVFYNKDNKVYNINDIDTEVTDNNLLTKVEYTFKKNNDNYYIYSINVVE